MEINFETWWLVLRLLFNYLKSSKGLISFVSISRWKKILWPLLKNNLLFRCILMSIHRVRSVRSSARLRIDYEIYIILVMKFKRLMIRLFKLQMRLRLIVKEQVWSIVMIWMQIWQMGILNQKKEHEMISIN